MVLTKGIILSLVNDAYYKRDRVALLTFRAAQAELLLPFTRSPQVAKHHLRSLAVGGKTPLGLGLKEAGILLRAERLKNAKVKPLLITVSDGKGNVALEYDDPYDEAMHYAELLQRSSIESIFIDTEEDPCSFGYGPQVARAMGGHYLLADDIIKRGVIDLPL
jgi:magnesium chelatase subunit D